LSKPLFRKVHLAAMHDSIMAAASFIISIFLRVGLEYDYSSADFLKGIFIFTCVSTLVFLSLRIYRRVWRYSSTQDLMAITKAVTLTIVIFLPLMFMINRLEGIPRSAIFINWFVLLALLGGPRFVYRMITDRTFAIEIDAIPESQKIKVLLIGANDHTELFLRDTVGNRYSNYKVVGILDKDPDKFGRYIRDIRIYGGLDSLETTIAKLKEKTKAPQKILIAPDAIDGAEVRKLLELSEKLGLTLAMLPKLTEFRQTDGEKQEVQPIAIEDLLGRPQNTLDRESMKNLIKDRNILITGSGGTIGSELVRQIASYKPVHITMYENSEHNLYLIDKELEESFPFLSRTPVIGDVRDIGHFLNTLKKEKPSIVFHAAALKHVPMSEMNATEAVLTNIIGTRCVADACIKSGIEEMIMISTDKAVNPTNVMGATKRVAEKYISALGDSGKAKKTKFITVRFGNVLGSTGSVIPLFQRQIANDGPLTVTHPEVTRYFMTVREAVELVLQASAMAATDEDKESKIYVLDMGEPVLIKSLAEQLIRLAGFKPGVDIQIEYTGLRPGEKLYEELFYDYENPSDTKYGGIMLASHTEVQFSEIEKILNKIEKAAIERNTEKSISLLHELLPEYKPAAN